MDKSNYDFSGWATRNDIRCSDGRVIKKNAFKSNDGEIVPLVWNHDHVDATRVLGHAMLENRDEGVYAYCSFNDTEQGKNAKELVKHGDICALSIYANKLQQDGPNVIHGAIREVSLVLAGANPGAVIENIIAHGEQNDEEAIIYNKNDTFEFYHNDEANGGTKMAEEKTTNIKSEDEETVQDVFDTLTDKQKNLVYILVDEAVEQALNGESTDEEKEGENTVKHNAFEGDNENNSMIHSEEFKAAVNDAKRYGSLKDSFLQHGITNIDYLYPDYENVTKTPGFINTNHLGCVGTIMDGVHHTPFSRVKMMFADITADEARARGFVKGNQKVEETFSLLKRTVDPQTVYKKQAFSRDDVIDITDFDVVAWVKAEMREKLDEELARAFIFGDGRSASSNDKINESKIIPVVTDTANNLYAMASEVTVEEGSDLGTALIDKTVKALDDYEGSGNITFFTSASYVSDMLLLKDKDGRRIYKDINELATAMTVNRIVKVPASWLPNGVVAVALDLADYNVGADKGGAVNMFDDFDIDYNAQKYLIETRCSGALVKPHSAIVLKYTA